MGSQRGRLSEKELQKAIIGHARLLGWRVGYFPRIQDVHGTWRTPVGADGKGFPDLLCLRDRVLVMEVKSDGGRVSPEQDEWLAAFRMAGVEACVVNRQMWEDGRVDAILRRRGMPVVEPPAVDPRQLELR